MDYLSRFKSSDTCQKREAEGDHTDKREGHVQMMWPHAKECMELSGAERGKEELHLLYFRLLPSKTVRE